MSIIATALLAFAVQGATTGPEPDGREAPAQEAPAPPASAAPAGALHHEEVESAALGERRRVDVYTPAGFDASRAYPVVYLTDGQLLAGWAGVVDRMIDEGRLPPVVIVGLWPAPATARNLRADQFLVGRDPARFRRHERFFLTEVVPMAETRYGASRRPEDRVLLGVSDGAAWALATGLEHPRMFRRVVALSLGWAPAAAHVGDRGRPELYFAAGTLEPDFLATTRDAAERARAVYGDARLVTLAGDHGPTLWTAALPDALRWALEGKTGSDGL